MKLAGNMLDAELEGNIAQARQWLEQGELNKAVTAYTRLIGSHPNVLSLNLGLGIALTFSQRFTEAEMVLQHALSQWPNQPDLLFSLADMAQRQGKVGKAEQLYRNGLAHHPQHLPCRQNLGCLLYQTWRFTEAARLHAETINLYPGHPASWRDLGQALVAAGHVEEGFNILTEACQRFPDDRETRFAFGLVALRKGEWTKGWNAYEARWLPGELEARIPNGCSLWTGQKIPAGKTLHILSEQGFGDNLMFARYLARLTPFADHISYVTHPALVTLMQSSFPNIAVNHQLAAQEGDSCLPIASLPRVLLEIAPQPPKIFPYLHPSVKNCDPALVENLNNLPKPFLAITWRGNQKGQGLATRSLQIRDILPTLQNTPCSTIVSLQKDPTPKETAELVELGIIDFSPLLKDFNATANILKAAEGLVSIDTAIVHLAGALGKPITLLQRPEGDWRWGTNHRGEAWYEGDRMTTMNIDFGHQP